MSHGNISTETPLGNNSYHTKNDLDQWLRQQRTKTPTTLHPSQNSIPDNIFPYQHRKQHAIKKSHQTTLQRATGNEYWGDNLENNDPNDKKFRVISRNVNTINAKKGSLSWHAITQAAIDVEADVLCLQETNINWSPEILQTARSIFNKSNYRTAKTTYSVSSEATDGTYQPGGTMTSVLGRWTARTTNSGQDKSGLGRWSYVELTGRRNTRFIILSGYRVNPQRPKLGANTIYDQQYRLLLHKGQTQPNPRQQFVEDLTEQVKIWRKENVEVLLCLDTNEDVTKLSFKNSIGTLIAATDLKDLHAHQHPQWPRPATYQRGVNTIDICLASPGYVKALIKTFILPFHYPPTMPGDHRTIGVEFNPAYYLDTWTYPQYVTSQSEE